MELQGARNPPEYGAAPPGGRERRFTCPVPALPSRSAHCSARCQCSTLQVGCPIGRLRGWRALDEGQPWMPNGSRPRAFLGGVPHSRLVGDDERH